MKVLDLFSGIGGFSLGLERAGMETVAFCEIEEYPRKVLAKHWPNVPIYNDVRELTGDRLRQDGISVDLICGGFPCQDISTAGNQAGIGEGTRSGLWSECARLLGDIRPRYAIFENVTNLLNGNGGDWFKRVLWEISQVGYDAEWHCIPASELGAHHHRDRVWIIAHPNRQRCEKRQSAEITSHAMQLGRGYHQHGSDPHGQRPAWGQQSGEFNGEGSQSNDQSVEGRCALYGGNEILPHANSLGQQGQGMLSESIFAETLKVGKTANALSGGQPEIWRTEPSVGRVADGVPNRAHRLKALGNAVVPQIPEIIGRAIMEGENA